MRQTQSEGFYIASGYTTQKYEGHKKNAGHER